jgi:Potential Queuosine, Q, salvage protein family
MDEVLQSNDFEDKSPFSLSHADTLGVLSSTRQVVEKGEYVCIDIERLQSLAQEWLLAGRENLVFRPAWYDQLHFVDGGERSVNWILVLDAVNFCFWAEKGQPPWSVEYAGERLNGYKAEAAALKRAVEEDIPLWDAAYLSSISATTLAHIFRGEQIIPLLQQRLHNLREVGSVLLEKYDGQFSHVVEEADASAVQLALLLAQDFPSFRDVTRYRGQPVRFLKRAQICVADLHTAFGGSSWGAFADIDRLSAFADYKLPQVLRQRGVLDYYPALAERIDNEVQLEPGSAEEIEIRAATIWACELLRREMLRLEQPLSAAEIDAHLWLMGQQAADMQPYHRTRTIFY